MPSQFPLPPTTELMPTEVINPQSKLLQALTILGPALAFSPVIPFIPDVLRNIRRSFPKVVETTESDLELGNSNFLNRPTTLYDVDNSDELYRSMESHTVPGFGTPIVLSTPPSPSSSSGDGNGLRYLKYKKNIKRKKRF